MATTYPGTIDTFTNPSGTSTLDSPDHALQHTNANGAVIAVETVLGTTAGTSIAKDFSAGQFAVRQNSSGVVPNQLTLGTPIADQIASSGTTIPTKINQGLAPTVVTLTDTAGGTMTANAAAGQVFNLVLGTAAGNRTLGTPVNATAGQAINYAVKASGSANGTLVWAGAFRFSQNSGTPTVGTGTTWNYFGWRYNGVDSKWDFQGQSLNVI